MKKIIRKGVILMALLSSIMTSANRVSYETALKEIDKTLITLDNVKIGQELFIKDINGSVIYQESIEVTGSFKKELDLGALPDGLYFIELNKDIAINVIPFTVNSYNAELLKDKETTIFKPVVKLKDNFVFIAKLSSAKEPVEIELYYDSNESHSGMYELLYTERITNTTTIHRVYKLDKYEKGNYKVVLKTEGRTFIEKVKL
tara:strand:+ start:2131 stop:2739 length:609 start_codon:yes stop_codon:yes gene_type:complete